MAYKWDGLHNLGHSYRRPGFLFYAFVENVSSTSPRSDFLFLLVSEIKECSTWNVSAKLTARILGLGWVGHSTGQRP
jgi:hypothetical protein